jgi:antitoxin SocA-like protein
MAGGIEFDSQKFKQLILYLAEKSGGDPGFAATKLNKLMYFCDFEAFRLLGHSITGARYQKLPWGPAAVEFLPLQDELFGEELARLELRERGPFIQRVTVPLSPSDPDVFLPRELEIVNAVIEELQPYDAAGASEYSHEKSAGWKSTPEREEIPYESAIISTERPPEFVFEHFRRLHGVNN